MQTKEPARRLASPWACNTDEVIRHFDVITDTGLSKRDVENRRAKYGPNALRQAKKTGSLVILVRQFRSLLVVLLILAAMIALAYDKTLEGVSIVIVLFFNAVIGYVTEAKAISSMEALRRLTRIDAYVRREREVRKIPARDIVPGDVAVLHAGDMVPADIRVILSSKLQTDESALTGESVPVSKSSSAVAADVPLAERSNMLYKGTFLTRGTAEGIVVATGMDTELGRISASIEGVAEEKTPLEKKLDELAKKLIPLLVVVAAIVGITGYLRGLDPLLMVEEAIALAIATVPEGLPIVATLVLARGMLRMAEHNVLINNLSSVETLGSTSVICTDKTGTLTENKMTVTTYEFAGRDVRLTGLGLEPVGMFTDGRDGTTAAADAALRKALEIGVLCNNASVSVATDTPEAMGDPMEVALLIAGIKGGVERESLLEEMPEAREVSFDPAVKMMATYHAIGQEYLVAVKGAPEQVVNACTAFMRGADVVGMTPTDRSAWMERGEHMAESGLRVLALAHKTERALEVDPYTGLTLIGLVGLMDPPRREVRPAIEECQKAGMRVIMITGDHAATAKNVAYQVGLISSMDEPVVQGKDLVGIDTLSGEAFETIIAAPIFARVTPENKLDIIEAHQRHGSIVAMTGDGVNDAPALKKADIGIAMGKRGTQVAREASDMILRDDNFSSIVDAVREGRIIFGNIRKFVVYLISCNLSELLAILFASLIGLPLPLLPLQILFLNVINDVFPAFALGACRDFEGIMDRKPNRGNEPILTRTNWLEMNYYGIMIALATIGSFYFTAGMPEIERITISFLTLAFAQLWHVFTMREASSPVIRNEVTENRYVWGALLICTLLLLAAVYVPGVSAALSTQPIDASGWTVVIFMSLLPLVAGQLERGIRRKA
ncbi:MAG: cation-translocating P-type ATPase [Candidatus Methanofastidiosa archaeon]|nr:cation-translocating P-type ATPase [Candidatus Methanofastidiosa archaeon]